MWNRLALPVWTYSFGFKHSVYLHSFSSGLHVGYAPLPLFCVPFTPPSLPCPPQKSLLPQHLSLEPSSPCFSSHPSWGLSLCPGPAPPTPLGKGDGAPPPPILIPQCLLLTHACFHLFSPELTPSGFCPGSSALMEVKQCTGEHGQPGPTLLSHTPFLKCSIPSFS